MKNALIGYSGFVGSSLLKQTQFEALFRSTNIHDIHGLDCDHIICAGAPAQKWIANKDPETDKKNIETLMENLKTISCKTFILISTVDVFKHPIDVDEATVVDESGLHPYGLHRRMLEKFVQSQFPSHLIVRLPGLVGPGLRKNIIFDLHNNNNLDAIDSRAIFQFYPMVNLWYDIQTALQKNLHLIHLTAEPISVSDVAHHGFGKSLSQALTNPPARYQLRTRYAQEFGVQGPYLYSARETLQAIRAYAQSEPITLKAEAGIPS